jgi:hypothetical protein
MTDEEAREMKKVPYINLVGSLMYAMLGTRPDIAYAVGALAKFNSAPRHCHWTAAKHVLRYIKSTLNYGIVFLSSGNDSLLGHCDADWAGDVDTRRSTTGYVFTLSGGAVSWASRRQQTIALSTTEAEYMATTEATKEACWLRLLLEDLGHSQLQPTLIKSDSQGALALVKNPVYHSRTKHIDIRHHFVREKYTDGTVNFEYCPTSDMIADILTKSLPKSVHGGLIAGFGLCSD